MKQHLARLALALLVGLAACEADRIAAPSDEATIVHDGLLLGVSMSDPSIGPGETASLTRRLRNVSDVSRQVLVSCNFFVYVKDERGVIVIPRGGGYVCPAVVFPPITLAPAEEYARSSDVTRGSDVAHTSFVMTLPRGRYTVFVELGLGGGKFVRSPEVAFEIESD